MAQFAGDASLSPSDSVSSEVRAEELWRETGECLALSKLNEKVMEKKEQQLKDAIQRNYSKLKGVEKELEALQLQLKLTSGPKKHALELFRKKIESQNEKVAASRSKYAAAKEFMLGAEKELKEAEAVKMQLCDELHLLVHQSSHAQLAKLEQLTLQLEELEAASTMSQKQSEDLELQQGSLKVSQNEKEQVHVDAQCKKDAGDDSPDIFCPVDGIAQGSFTRSAPAEHTTSGNHICDARFNLIGSRNGAMNASTHTSPAETSTPSPPGAQGSEKTGTGISPGRTSVMRLTKRQGEQNDVLSSAPSRSFQGFSV